MSHIVYIGIGSNLGNALQNVRKAIEFLQKIPETSLDASSSLYKTAPVDASGDDYINAVVRLKTMLDAHKLLEELWRIENSFGRERPFRNAPRTLDLDILLYDSGSIQTNLLTVPHPRMTERAFVLVPLHEISPDLCIPGAEPLSTLIARLVHQKISCVTA